MSIRCRLAVVPFAFALLSGCAYKHKDADLVIHNAHIVTLDSADHEFQAMAIKDGRVIELGPENQILNEYTAKETYDAAGRTVYSGFIDGHCHFFGYGLNKQKIDLQGVKNWEEAIEKFKEGLEINRRSKNRFGEAIALGGLGNVYRMQGRWEEALQKYAESLAIAEEQHDRSARGLERPVRSAPGWAALERSIRDKLFRLPDDTVCFPGHGPETTIGRERQTNPFVLEYLAGS